MRKALILGAGGFVGGYLRKELCEHGYQVVSLSRHSEPPCDILNDQQLYECVTQVRPDYIFHLAAQSSVAKSWKYPALTFDINVMGTINLLEVLRQTTWPVRTLIVGSSDQYGRASTSVDGMLDETMMPNPSTPYAISKCTQESLGTLYVKTYGLDIVLTRSFNHIGVGQKIGFVVPDFIQEILDVEFGCKDKVRVGNLMAERDFTDVRDVVRAYRMLVECGRSGQIYNVGRGETCKIKDIFDYLCTLSPVDIQVELAPEKIRPVDVKCLRCNRNKITSEIGWQPEIPLHITLTEMMQNDRMMRKEKNKYE